MEEEEDMNATKPIEATELTFNCNKEYEKITEIIRNPAKPSPLVKTLFNNYKNRRR